MLFKSVIAHFILDVIAVISLFILAIAGYPVFYFIASLYMCSRGSILGYGLSRDYFQLACAFYLSSSVFVIVPGLTFYLYSIQSGGVWQSALLPRLAVRTDDIVSAIIVVSLGVLAIFLGDYLYKILDGWKSVRQPKNQANSSKGSSALAYFFLSIPSLLLGLTLLVFDLGAKDYGPAAGKSSIASSGIYSLLLAILSICSYYLARSMRFKYASFLIFLPAIFLALLTTNRGIILTVILMMATAVFNFRSRFILLGLLLGYITLSYAATILLFLRQNAINVNLNPIEVVGRFLSESIMFPTLSLVLNAISNGSIAYQYGIDLITAPILLVPRSFWPDKPLPLDFRVNQVLNLGNGDIFGTPVSIFGGFYINFGIIIGTILFFVLGFLLNYFYRKVKDDDPSRVIAFVFVIDLVRVGDISREVLTLFIWIVALKIIKKFIYFAPQALEAARSYNVQVAAND